METMRLIFAVSLKTLYVEILPLPYMLIPLAIVAGLVFSRARPPQCRPEGH